MINNKEIQFCTLNEIANLINSNERLVYIDDGIIETIGKYDDIPDIIIDLNKQFGSMDLNIYDFDTPNNTPILSTNGLILNQYNYNTEKNIIDRLIKLQLNNEKVKDYKLIDEYDLEIYYEFLKGDGEYERD